jgi:hypothetical protein
MYYRFNCGVFREGNTFEEAKQKLIVELTEEIEDHDSWHTCTCLGLSHRYDCPEKKKEGIPF